MDQQPRFLIAEDWSSWGDISLQTATTLFQMWGLPHVSLPVQLLAAHTGWDAQAPKQDLYSWVCQTLDYWHSQSWAGIYLGYLGSVELVDIWEQYLTTTRCPVIIDPAMADGGQLYQHLDADYVSAQRRLLALADIYTPNLSEAQLLLGCELKTDAQLTAGLLEFRQLMHGEQIVITSVKESGQIGCAYIEQSQLQKILLPQQPRQLFGSGDLFTSLLALLIFSGWSWVSALRQATRLTSLAIEQTPTAARDVQLAPLLRPLLQLRDEQHE